MGGKDPRTISAVPLVIGETGHLGEKLSILLMMKQEAVEVDSGGVSLG